MNHPSYLSKTYVHLRDDMEKEAPYCFPERRNVAAHRLPLHAKIRILLHCETYFVEAGLSAVCAVFGLFILFSIMTVGVNYPFLPHYFLVRTGHAEQITGGWLIILGILRGASLFFGSVRARFWCALLAFATWFYLLTWVGVNDWHRLSMVFFAGAAITSAWICWRGPTEWEE